MSPFLRRPEAAAIISLIAILAFYAALGGVNLVTLFGAASWLNFAANLGIVAIPVGMLMISGHIDISIGAMIPAGSMTIAILSGYYELPIWVGILGTLSLAAVVGLVNGILTARTTVPSLIITLSTLVVMQGVVLAGANLLTGGSSVALTSPHWAKSVFGSLIGGSHQVVIVWWLGFAAILAFLLHKTRFGNWVFAMGGDLVSARNAGVPTTRLTIVLFMLSAMSAAFVGMCGAIQFNSAQVSGGMGYIFNAIVSVVVGGVVLTGGFGSVLGIFVGTITFAIVSQGIYFTDIDRNWSSLIIGVTLLLAVAMNESFRKFALRSGPKPRTSAQTIAAQA
jgi:simple sugar transport system permease protein